MINHQLKIAVVGAGHLGKIHLKCLNQIPEFNIIGFYDIDPDIPAQVEKQYEVKAYDDLKELVDQVDAVDIVTPTPTHFEIASLCLQRGKHVFIEKPVTSTLQEANRLVELSNQYPDLKVQVGHVERFNPAIQAIQHIELNPKFIEVHRLAQFNPRGIDVSVILDLMIHDLDILLSLVDSEVNHVVADGVNILSDTEDICNARLEWKNGCVANVTASRISIKNMRKLRIFQPDAYVGIDFLKKETQVIRLLDHKPIDNDNVMELESPKGKKYVSIDMPESQPSNAILEELNSFRLSIIQNSTPRVSLHEATKALELASWIIESIQERQSNR